MYSVSPENQVDGQINYRLKSRLIVSPETQVDCMGRISPENQVKIVGGRISPENQVDFRGMHVVHVCMLCVTKQIQVA